jgi:predicted DNA-binding transcriptional regulator AlpA
MNTTDALLQINRKLEELAQLITERADEMLDVAGLQALTGLSRSAIYQKTCSQGGAPPELPHYKQGKRLYFKRSEVIDWMTQNRVRNRTETDALAAVFTPANRRRGS